MNNLILLEDEARYRRTRLMQEAEHHRLVQLAVSGHENHAPYQNRALGQLGSWLVTLGQHLQAQDTASVDSTADAAFGYQHP